MGYRCRGPALQPIARCSTRRMRRGAHRRRSTARRQDGGLRAIERPDEIYLVPSAVLRGFAAALPKPTAIYYTAVTYATPDGGSPNFAQPPASLALDGTVRRRRARLHRRHALTQPVAAHDTAPPRLARRGHRAGGGACTRGDTGSGDSGRPGSRPGAGRGRLQHARVRTPIRRAPLRSRHRGRTSPRPRHRRRSPRRHPNRCTPQRPRRSSRYDDGYDSYDDGWGSGNGNGRSRASAQDAAYPAGFGEPAQLVDDDDDAAGALATWTPVHRRRRRSPASTTPTRTGSSTTPSRRHPSTRRRPTPHPSPQLRRARAPGPSPAAADDRRQEGDHRASRRAPSPAPNATARSMPTASSRAGSGRAIPRRGTITSGSRSGSCSSRRTRGTSAAS